jgi:hypothetical protein
MPRPRKCALCHQTGAVLYVTWECGLPGCERARRYKPAAAWGDTHTHAQWQCASCRQKALAFG